MTPEGRARPALRGFDLERAIGPERPIVVEVPHAGLAVPDDVRSELVMTREDVLRDADLFVDRLYASAPRLGASLLRAQLSRYVVDLNRAEDDVSLEIVPDHPAPRPTQRRGVVWRTTTAGAPALARGTLRFTELEHRLERYHRPYHRALAGEVERKRRLFGRVLVVCAHSMPSLAHPSRMRHADVVPGSQGGTTTSRRVLSTIDEVCRLARLDVRHDEPYRGGYTTRLYGRPSEGIHAVQIELNRALYVDERTSEPIDDGFARLERVIEALLEALGAVEL